MIKCEKCLCIISYIELTQNSRCISTCVYDCGVIVKWQPVAVAIGAADWWLAIIYGLPSVKRNYSACSYRLNLLLYSILQILRLFLDNSSLSTFPKDLRIKKIANEEESLFQNGNSILRYSVKIAPFATLHEQSELSEFGISWRVYYVIGHMGRLGFLRLSKELRIQFFKIYWLID